MSQPPPDGRELAPDQPPSAVPVRDASTVLLVRDDPAGGRPQVWMMTRVAEMAFAAGSSVFPGGRLDDSDALLPWSGRPVEEFAAILDCDATHAHALVGAAVRETFEETGVLLTSPAAALAGLQADVEAGRLTFGALLADHGLAIDADALLPWGRWITPPWAPTTRRYDTRFFVALLPAGAEAADVSTESTTAGWITPADAVAAATRGEIHVMPPTRSMLTSIVDAASVEEIVALAGNRSLVAVSRMPRPDQPGQPASQREG